MILRTFPVLFLAFLWAIPLRAEIVDVNLPLKLDAEFLTHAVTSQVFVDPGDSARVWDDGSGCNYMVLSDPRVDTTNGGLRLTTRGEARVGTGIGDRCVLLVDWGGMLETFQVVSLEPGAATVRFEVVDSSLPDGGALTGTLWDLVKDYVHPRISAVRIDLQPALNELRAVLPILLPGDPAVVGSILDSVAIRSVALDETSLNLVLGFSVPTTDVPPALPMGPEPALDAEELARFQAATQSWDSFITFIVKYVLATSATANVRRDLLYVLIEARYDILRILAETPSAAGPDPARTLFLRTWTRLAPVLRQLSPASPGQQGLNLLSFIAAADALAALDAIGPRIELELSADGLRRMARVLAPESTSDPLEYNEGVDPELRRLFDFGPPPVPHDEPVPPVPQDAPSGEPLGFLSNTLVSNAFAQTRHDDKLLKRLKLWVPAKSEMPEYLPLVAELLNVTAINVANDSELEPGLHNMFRAMVLATAWQETCWRQFMVRSDKVVALRSSAGAVGIMQVLPSVWRGFYDVNGLVWDTAYNAAAGSEILMHYLLDYAIDRGEHEQRGGVDNLPRATYAAYHGGPSHLSRYRSSGVAGSLQRIDQAFWEKYSAVASGDELAVLSCFED
jgi:hypothetical protein